MLRGMTTVTFQADDLAEAGRWYTGLLGFPPSMNRPEYIEFRLGDYQAELGILDRRYTNQLGVSDASPAGVILYWHVDDVQAAFDRLLAMGATAMHAPRDFGENFVGAAVTDPFGNVLGVMRNPHYIEMLVTLKG